MLSEEDWYKFANGGISYPVPVFRLPPALSSAMGAHVDLVHIHPMYAGKLRFKHSLSPDYFPLMPATLARGTVLQQRDGKLAFFLTHEVPHGLLELVVKATRHGHQLWVCTYHKQSKSEFARKQRRYKMLRP